MKLILFLGLTLGIVSCQSIVPLEVAEPPATCLPPEFKDLIPKLGTNLRQTMEAFKADASSNPTVRVFISQCFRSQEYSIDPYNDLRINPNPKGSENFNNPKWKAENYTAWEASIIALRKSQYDDLENYIKNLSSKAIIEKRELFRQEIVALLPAETISALAKRTDVINVMAEKDFILPPI
jgi:hypothetical protein